MKTKNGKEEFEKGALKRRVELKELNTFPTGYYVYISRLDDNVFRRTWNKTTQYQWLRKVVNWKQILY